MLERLANLPTATLLGDARRLEAKLIEGSASGDEIDRFVTIELELAARDLRASSLDAVLDPRD